MPCVASLATTVPSRLFIFPSFNQVPVIVKNQRKQDGETVINNAFDKLCPPKQYEKPLAVNGKLMLIKPAAPPAYKEKEKNGRHVFAFDINIIHKR